MKFGFSVNLFVPAGYHEMVPAKIGTARAAVLRSRHHLEAADLATPIVTHLAVFGAVAILKLVRGVKCYCVVVY